MSNKITEKYFEHEDKLNQLEQAIQQISTETGFIPEKEIFRGQIYDKDKVASLIYKGTFQEHPAALKVQGLKPEIEETEIINKFNSQNKSKIIRLPKVYKKTDWNETDGQGYSIVELVEAPQIYEQPFASPEQIAEFCRFYTEYKENCLQEPLFEKQSHEENSLDFTLQRVNHWAKISQSKGHLTEEIGNLLDQFKTLVSKYLPESKMEFMHGHLTANDIFKISENEFVLMSNLFWGYRPEYYDTTFHLWAGIKSIQDTSLKFSQIVQYVEEWFSEYQKIPSISQDPGFKQKFYVMLAERCIGSLLVDIPNQNYSKDSEKIRSYLMDIFKELFKYCSQKFSE